MLIFHLTDFHELQLFKFAGDVSLAILLSILASLALESPIVIIEKVIFGSGKRRETIAEVPKPSTAEGEQSHPSAPEDPRPSTVEGKQQYPTAPEDPEQATHRSD